MNQVVFFQIGVGHYAFEECKIFAKSLRRVGKCPERLVVVTNQAETDETKQLNMELIQISVATKHASPLKFKCFDILRPSMRPDGWVFFLDSDFVTITPVDLPAVIARCDINKVNVYGFQEQGRTQDHAHMAGKLTRDPKILKQDAFCAGLFLVNQCNRKAERVFRKIRESYMDLVKDWEKKPGDTHDPGHGDEQPRFCLHLLRNDLANVLLSPLVDEYRNRRKFKRGVKPTAAFMHFCGGTALGYGRNTKGRIQRMQKVFRNARDGKKVI